MRGSPLLRAVIAFVIIAAFAFPLWELTHRSAKAALDPATLGVEAKRVQLDFALTVPAAKISVLHLGKLVWSGEPKDGQAAGEVSLPWPREGVDLKVQIKWPEDAPLAAARVRVTDPEMTEHVQTIWSAGPAEEILTFR